MSDDPMRPTTPTSDGTARLPIASGRVVLREAARTLGRRWWQLVLLVVVLVAAAAAGIVSPLALGAVVDAVAEGLGSGDASQLWRLGAVMAGAIVLGAALTAVGVIAASRLFERVLADLRERMVDAAFRLPQAQVERAGTGDLISRAGDDVAVVSEAIPNVVPALSSALFTIVVTVVGMAVIDPWYALALVVVLPVHVIAVRGYLRRAPAVYAAERAAMADRAQHLLDSLRGIQTVRAYGLAPHHLGRIARASWRVVRITMRARAIQNTFFARLNLAEFLGMAGLLVVGFALVANGVGTIGGTTAAMLLFLRLFGPINQLLFVIDDLQSALASLARIVGVIVARPAAAPTSACAAPAATSSHVTPSAPAVLRMAGIEHAYLDGHPVLHGVDLVLERGETVAVVGASGAGKSTLAAIAAGLHDPAAGTVHHPRSTVLVTQEVHVFAASLRDNLTLAAPPAPTTAPPGATAPSATSDTSAGVDVGAAPAPTDADLTRILHRVGAHRLLARLPAGLDEPLGADGTALTPAEAQLLALARVLLADPELLILDEATSEAGSSDAEHLERAAAEAGRGRTVLLVAHRLSQSATADRVVLMEHGRIAEHGTHAALLTADGPYARLWRAWSTPR